MAHECNHDARCLPWNPNLHRRHPTCRVTQAESTDSGRVRIRRRPTPSRLHPVVLSPPPLPKADLRTSCPATNWSCKQACWILTFRLFYSCFEAQRRAAAAPLPVPLCLHMTPPLRTTHPTDNYLGGGRWRRFPSSASSSSHATLTIRLSTPPATGRCCVTASGVWEWTGRPGCVSPGLPSPSTRYTSTSSLPPAPNPDSPPLPRQPPLCAVRPRCRCPPAPPLPVSVSSPFSLTTWAPASSPLPLVSFPPAAVATPASSRSRPPHHHHGPPVDPAVSLLPGGVSTGGSSAVAPWGWGSGLCVVYRAQ